MFELIDLLELKQQLLLEHMRDGLYEIIRLVIVVVVVMVIIIIINLAFFLP